MAKKPESAGRSGNPAKRAHQPAVQRIEKAFRRSRKGLDFDEEILAILRLGETLHTALAARGWEIFDDDEPADEYSSVWNASYPEQDHVNEVYYEATGVDLGEDCIIVEFAALQVGPFSSAKYENLDKLLLDITVIEAFRYGDPAPELPHAQETAWEAKTPSMLRG